MPWRLVVAAAGLVLLGIGAFVWINHGFKSKSGRSGVTTELKRNEGDSSVGNPRIGGRAASKACAKHDFLNADLDGNNAPDSVYHEWIKDRAVLGVCMDSGLVDKIRGAGQSELLQTIDIQNDGRDEIFYGGTTAAAQIFSIVVFLNDEIRIVRDEGDKPLTLVSGLDPGIVSKAEPAGAAFGCEDSNDDGDPELVQISTRPAGKTSIEWTRNSYQVARASATLVAKDSGKVEADPEQPEIQQVMDVASVLVEPCHVKGTR